MRARTVTLSAVSSFGLLLGACSPGMLAMNMDAGPSGGGGDVGGVGGGADSGKIGGMNIDSGMIGCAPRLDAGLQCTRACYGGWVCNHATGKCVAPGTLPDAGACAGTGGGRDGGGSPPMIDSRVVGGGGGAVTSAGGTVSALAFAVLGDVRPPNENETSSYPTAIITSIMQGIQGLGAQFVVATGDYMFATDSADVNAQLNLLLSAESMYTGFVAHTMGNHECTGATASNCPNFNETPNVQAFMSRLVPFSPTPYYYFVVHTSMGDAKFVMVAANAWSSAQDTWLRNTLAIPSAYTFVARHESPSASTAPGVSPSDSDIAAASPPVTLELFGHTHEYSHYGTNQVISGNGGAPLSSGGSYGYLWVVQRADGNIAVTEYQQGTNTPTDSWAVTPTGAATM